MLKSLTTNVWVIITFILFFINCSSDESSTPEEISGFNSIVNVENAASGCPGVGIIITVGQDINRNDILDTSEIQSTSFICNGTSSAPLLGTTVDEPPGSNCELGGNLISIGTDLDSDETLDDDEVQTTFFVCNSTDTETNGAPSLTNVIVEEPGENCSNGGLFIEVGLDLNANGALDANEATASYYICNGRDGRSTLINVIDEDAGNNCTAGGLKIEVGEDVNENGILDEELNEISITRYVCNGENGGGNGVNSLIVTTPIEPDTECAEGGVRMDVGIDEDQDGTLQAGEIDATQFICNGSTGDDGNKSLLNITSFRGTQGRCNNGGLSIQSGIDENNDNILQEGEVITEQLVCNGSDGRDGSSDGVFEFYFASGMDNYEGTSDATIAQDMPEQNFGNNALLNVAVDIERIRRSALLHFGGLEKVAESIPGNYTIVEAILYLRVTTSSVNSNLDNWLGLKTLRTDGPLFEESSVSWLAASSDSSWGNGGFDDLINANGYSDMFRLPSGIDFEGIVPLRINKTEVAQWIADPEQNKGMVVQIVNISENDNVQNTFQTAIHSSENKETTFSPVLYLKAQSTNGRLKSPSDSQYLKKWQEWTIEEKLEPWYRRK